MELLLSFLVSKWISGSDTITIFRVLRKVLPNLPPNAVAAVALPQRIQTLVGSGVLVGSDNGGEGTSTSAGNAAAADAAAAGGLGVANNVLTFLIALVGEIQDKMLFASSGDEAGKDDAKKGGKKETKKEDKDKVSDCRLCQYHQTSIFFPVVFFFFFFFFFWSWFWLS